jgi:hypothetical protein
MQSNAIYSCLAFHVLPRNHHYGVSSNHAQLHHKKLWIMSQKAGLFFMSFIFKREISFLYLGAAYNHFLLKKLLRSK